MLFLNIARKRHASYADKLQLDAKQAMYINRVSMDQRAGKDIRIFNLSGWLWKNMIVAWTTWKMYIRTYIMVIS